MTVDVLTGYARWAKSYPAYAHNPLMEIEEQAMSSLLPEDLSGQVCLDLACGSGRYMRLLQARQAKQICGVDYSPNMLDRAMNMQFHQRHDVNGTQVDIIHTSEPEAPCGQFRAKGPLWAIQSQRPPMGNSQLTRSTFLALPFTDATFDLITCALAVGHEQNLNQAMTEIARVLQVGGEVIYSDFHPFGTLSGWQRSFTTPDGDTFCLEHYLHLYGDHQRACRMAGLTITAVLEPVAGEQAPPGFQQIPVVLVIQAVK